MFSCFHDTYSKENLKHFQDIKWYDLLIQCKNIDPNENLPKLPNNKADEFFIKIANSPLFEIFIICIICLNAIIMTLDYDSASDSYVKILEKFEFTFLIIFLCEAIIKIVAYGLGYYLTIGANRLDMFILILGIMEMIIDLIITNSTSILKTLQLIRLFRIFRLFRVIR